jgi:serine/threonine protein kinase
MTNLIIGETAEKFKIMISYPSSSTAKHSDSNRSSCNDDEGRAEIIDNDDGTIIKRNPYYNGIVEMAAYSRIGSHPNILKPRSAEAIVERGKMYIYITTPKMKVINGEHIKARGVDKWLNDMVAALLYLNSISISHNDIKIDNMLYDGETDNYLLFDFNFATCGHESLQHRWCSYQTMAPEIIHRNYSGDKSVIINVKSEVYSLGMVLYQVVTGKEPLYTINIQHCFDSITDKRKNRDWLIAVKTSKWYELIELMTRYDINDRVSLTDIFSGINCDHDHNCNYNYSLAKQLMINIASSINFDFY